MQRPPSKEKNPNSPTLDESSSKKSEDIEKDKKNIKDEENPYQEMNKKRYFEMNKSYAPMNFAAKANEELFLRLEEERQKELKNAYDGNFSGNIIQKENTRIITGKGEQYTILNKIGESRQDLAKQSGIFLEKNAGVLGKGSFGEVAIAKRESDGKFIVVKKIKEFSPNSRIANDVQAEAKMSELVSETGIKGLNGAIDHVTLREKNDNFSYYQFSEFANIGDGNKFALLLNKLSVNEKNEILSFMTQSLLLTLNKMHEEKIYHRDLKPANILAHYDPATQNLNFKITDFGSAALYNIHSQRIIGNYASSDARYSPPESYTESFSEQFYQMEDKARDLWKMGLSLLQLISPEANKYVKDNFLMEPSWHQKTSYEDKLDHYKELYESQKFKDIVGKAPPDTQEAIKALLNPNYILRKTYIPEKEHSQSAEQKKAFAALADLTVTQKRSDNSRLSYFKPSDHFENTASLMSLTKAEIKPDARGNIAKLKVKQSK